MGSPAQSWERSGAYGQKSRRLSLIQVSWMVCQYSRRALVSSEKHETAAKPGEKEER
jgi:hypothetical protein